VQEYLEFPAGQQSFAASGRKKKKKKPKLGGAYTTGEVNVTQASTSAVRSYRRRPI